MEADSFGKGVVDVCEIRPVKKARKPAYPRKEYAMVHPELLERLPRRWRECRRAAAAAGLLAAMAATAGCGKPATQGTSTPPLQASPTPALPATVEPYIMGTASPLSFVSEGEAIGIIREILSGVLPGPLVACQVEEVGKPVKYVADYYQNRYRVVELQDTVIDVFHPGAGAGIEYLGESGEDAAFSIEATGAIEYRADKDNAYVLLIPPEGLNSRQEDEEAIRMKVLDFLKWVNAINVE